MPASLPDFRRRRRILRNLSTGQSGQTSPIFREHGSRLRVKKFLLSAPGRTTAGPGLAFSPRLNFNPEALDALYLFGCFAEWEAKAEATPAWELISAALCSHEDTRAQARALLGSSARMAARG